MSRHIVNSSRRCSLPQRHSSATLRIGMGLQLSEAPKPQREASCLMAAPLSARLGFRKAVIKQVT